MVSRYYATPFAMLRSLFKNRELIWVLVKRDFIGRYKGSFLGVVWSFFNPLLMLGIYTVVFSVAFHARWGGGDQSRISFGIVLFSGIVINNLFAECLNRSPDLIVSHQSYVKKVVFPLDILPFVAFFSALLHFFVSFIILIVFCALVGMSMHISAILIPIVLMPLTLMILGFSWIFASLGVYLRDLSQAMGLLTTISLFLSPIFYRIDSLPHAYRAILAWNPITLPVINLRNLLLWGRPVHWGAWSISLIIGMVICQAGYWWFQKSRRGFADVL